MAVDLNAVIEPGETIIHRSSGRSIAGPCIAYGSILVTLSVLLLLMGAGRITTLEKFGTLAGICVALLVFLIWQRSKPDQLIVTDRRVLFADGDWDNKSVALPLDSLEGFTWSTHNWARELFVAGAGQTIRLSDLRDCDASVKAIANAADLQAPPALGPLTAVNLPDLGGLVATCLIFPVLRFGLDPLIVTLLAELFATGGGWFDLAWTFTLLAIALLFGWLSGGLIIASGLRGGALGRADAGGAMLRQARQAAASHRPEMGGVPLRA